MTWRSVRADIEAAIRVVRAGPGPDAAGPPRAERLAAAGMALTVLLGAVVTYLVLLGSR